MEPLKQWWRSRHVGYARAARQRTATAMAAAQRDSGAARASQRPRQARRRLHVSRRPALGAVVTALEVGELGVELLELQEAQASGEVVQLKRVVCEVVDLAFAVAVLDVQEPVGPHRLVGGGISAAHLLEIGVAGGQMRAPMLDEDRVSPVGGSEAAEQ